MREAGAPLELYFHIPFCVRKCGYCDFLSFPADPAVRERYMRALLKETEERGREAEGYTVRSVFIGGGTPTAVDAEWIRALLEQVRWHYALVPEPEITIECNPGTADWEKLRAYRRAGVSRLSIGLQSSNDEDLKRLGRIHTWAQFQETYRLAREAGFDNINVDVMSALPGQTPESYIAGLERVLALKPIPEHISAYSLIVEEGTPFAAEEAEGRLDVPDEECERLMYWETDRLLSRAGYRRYEISNYALEGQECIHNCGYWRRISYLGFGIGAASLMRETRFSNESGLEGYLKDPLAARGAGQILSVQDRMEEFFFLGLRLSEGVDRAEFASCFGTTPEEVYGEVIRRNLRDGLLEYGGKKGNKLRLTRRGTDLSNYVMAGFLF